MDKEEDYFYRKMYKDSVNFLFESLFNLIKYNYPQFKWHSRFDEKDDEKLMYIKNAIIPKPFKLAKEIVIQIIMKNRRFSVNINQGNKPIAYNEFFIEEFTLENSEDFSKDIFVWVKENIDKII